MEYAVEQVNVCKELKAVFDVVEVVAVDAKAKKKSSEIMADALPKLILALEGLSSLSEELKDEQMMETVALSLVGIVKALKK